MKVQCSLFKCEHLQLCCWHQGESQVHLFSFAKQLKKGVCVEFDTVFETDVMLGENTVRIWACDMRLCAAYEIKITEHCFFSTKTHTYLTAFIQYHPIVTRICSPRIWGEGLRTKAAMIGQNKCHSLIFICAKINMVSSRTMVYQLFSLLNWHLLISRWK